MSCNYRPSKLDKPTLLGHCPGHDKKKDPTKLHCGSCEEDHPTLLGHCASHDKKKDATKLHCGSCEEDHPTLLGHCASHDKKKDPTKLGHCADHDEDPTLLARDLSWDNIVHDLQNFSLTQHDHHVFINTLPEKYEVCNITRFDGNSIPTVNDVADVSRSDRPSCYLYCAHEKCSSAEKYAEKYWDHLSDRCSSISYIKPGAREMLNNDKFSLQDKSACRSVL